MSSIYYEDFEMQLEVQWVEEGAELTFDIKKWSARKLVMTAVCTAYPWETINHVTWRVKKAVIERMFAKKSRKCCVDVKYKVTRVMHCQPNKNPNRFPTDTKRPLGLVLVAPPAELVLDISLTCGMGICCALVNLCTWFKYTKPEHLMGEEPPVGEKDSCPQPPEWPSEEGGEEP